MIIDILWHKDTGAKRFNYWIGLKYYEETSSRNLRKTIIKKLESFLGPVGTKWHYQLDHYQIILKLNDEKDFLFFLLKLG